MAKNKGQVLAAMPAKLAAGGNGGVLVEKTAVLEIGPEGSRNRRREEADVLRHFAGLGGTGNDGDDRRMGERELQCRRGHCHAMRLAHGFNAADLFLDLCGRGGIGLFGACL